MITIVATFCRYRSNPVWAMRTCDLGKELLLNLGAWLEAIIRLFSIVKPTGTMTSRIVPHSFAAG